MSKRLVIAEKPSVAADIARALGGMERKKDYFEGDEYVVTSVVGHIVEMYNPEEETADRKRAPGMRKSKWSQESLPALPKEFALRPHKDTETRTKLIGRLAKRKEVTGIINACDAGREGELIFANLANYLNNNKPVERLWLQSMTAAAIRKGFASLREERETASLRAAALARAQADWLVGINSTRALTALNSKDGGFQLTPVGRVQTPTLAFLVERQRVRDAHVARPYWRVEADFAVDAGSWRASLIDPKFTKDADDADARRDRMWDEQEANQAAAAVRGKQAAVSDESKLQNRQPPLLFNLSALQREANRRFGMSANSTLRTLQRLYERKLLTYPRTDSRHLPPDYVAESKRIAARLAAPGPAAGSLASLAEHCGGNRLDAGIDAAGKRVFDAAKVSDHFAIIPTGELPGQLNRDVDRRLFELVCRSFIATFMPPAKVRVTTRRCTIDLDDGESEAVFERQGQVVVEAGWMAAMGRELRDDNLPKVAEGELASVGDVEVQQHVTKPPPRFTDATLLSEMERSGRLVEDAELSEALTDVGGLGTPATRASIIEELIHNDYVVRDGRELAPTRKAASLMEILGGMGIPELTKPELTGKWESRLAGIEHGEGKPDEFLEDIRALVKNITGISSNYDPDATEGDWQELEVPCPQCGGQMTEAYRKYFCRNCKYFLWKNIASRILSPAEAEVLLREKRVGPLEGFKSRRGQPFEASLVLLDSGKVELEFGLPESGDPDTMESVGSCPKCGSQVLAGEHNYICRKALSTERECDFSVRRQLLDRELAPEEFSALLKDRRTGLLDGFVSRKRRKLKFAAHLTLADDGKLGFEFAESKPRPKTSKGRGQTSKAKAIRKSTKSSKSDDKAVEATESALSSHS